MPTETSDHSYTIAEAIVVNESPDFTEQLDSETARHIFPIFGGSDPGENGRYLPAPPPWREFKGDVLLDLTPPVLSDKDTLRATTFRCGDPVKVTVSAALALRRPVLI